MRTAHPIFVLFALLPACTSVFASLVADRVVADHAAIESYHGRYLEQYGDERIVREVRYRKPGLVRIEVLEPAERRGELILYSGSTIVMWSPRDRIGIRVRGVQPPSEVELRDVIRQDAVWSLDTYAFDFLGEARKADRLVNRWKATPTRHGPILYPHESWMDDRYSFPLRLEIHDQPNHRLYLMNFEQIVFNEEVSDDLFSFSFPSEALVFDWDLAEGTQDLEALKKELSFEPLIPQVPAEMTAKIVRARSGIPMLLYYAEHNGRWLAVAETHNFGRALSLGTGIPVQFGVETAALTLMGNVATLSFTADDVSLLLMGNLPYPQLAEVATTLTRKKSASPPRSYRAVVLEQYGTHPPLKKAVALEQAKLTVELLEPESRSESFVYDGETISIWWNDQVGVRIKGVKPPSLSELEAVAKHQALSLLHNYQLTFRGTEQRVGREAHHWSLKPKAQGLFAMESWLDAEIGLPLLIEVGDSTYRAEILELELNGPGLNQKTFPNKEMLVLEWDLRDPSMAEDEPLPFPLLLPDLPHGIEVKKILKPKPDLPAILVAMGKAGWRLWLTESRYFAGALETPDGVPIRIGEHAGQLLYLGPYVALRWAVGNTQLLLVGNLPAEEMRTVAASIKGPKAKTRVQSYRGRVVERYAEAKPVTKTIALAMPHSDARPHRVRVEVLSPKKRAGELLLYDGQILSIWWPQHLFGVRIRDVANVERARRVLANNAIWQLRHFQTKYEGEQEVAGRVGDRFSFTPRKEGHASTMVLDRATSLPLEAQIFDQQQTWYRTTHETFETTTLSEDRFRWRFPKNAVVIDWDLSDADLPLAKAKRLMNFQVLMPKKLPPKMKVTRRIKARHALPMLLMVLDNGIHRVTLTQARKAVATPKIGVPITIGAQQGYLSFMGPYTVVSWSRGNTALLLVGDLPYPELIAIATSVAP